MNTSPSLPSFPPLPVHNLAASLRDVTNACKIYWLLALLDHVREDGAAMVARDEGMRG